MSRSVFITSFDGTTLDNGTTLCQEYVLDSGPQVRQSLILDVDGNMYDVDGTGDNTVTPGTVTVALVVKQTSAANFVTTSNSIIALRKTEGTLTGTDANSGTITCEARCIDVQFETRAEHHLRFWQRFILVFAQKTNWA